ncbi:Signal transduction histidine-protein kinase BarA [Acaryochloris thomasi RCC1774]|uniref:Signal transduction histidine-protein kinase BarA n=1 Tax=Acaryochloris thomasi RCC1774 TaxID=1764569 RepID=A0A2W1JP36_9CYAN|nr:response regulator [Acaryochloris thomasi]PZD75100.1 Signal transduction histidine-protein kinase BarA [Acaryochloris thomasi RCC1774]
MKQEIDVEIKGQLTSNTPPKAILSQLVASSSSGILEVVSCDAVWRIYVEGGQLVFASHSINPSDVLDRHLKDFSRIVPAINQKIKQDVRALSNRYDARQDLPFSYQAIRWLQDQNYLNTEQVMLLIKRLSQEALESYLLLVAGDYRFISRSSSLDPMSRLDLLLLVQECQYRIKAWRDLGPEIWSPYQGLYYFSQSELQRQSGSEKLEKYGGVLRGFSFRKLAVILGQDELSLAQDLYSEITEKTIILREPIAPYHLFPRFSDRFPSSDPNLSGDVSYNPQEFADQFLIENKTGSMSQYTVICIDDSPAILKMVQRYLIQEKLCPILIDDPIKALVKVIKSNPSLILLDVEMPRMDGYDLCRMLRKHPQLKDTPIIMVTGRSGFINRAKAKVVGATDYLTKPFDSSELSNKVFRYLESA